MIRIATINATLTIFAAASLTNVFPSIDPAQTYSFAGSNSLAAQIRQGAPADIFASANTSIPQQLYADGLVEKPVVFTRNALILIVPRSNPAHIHSVYDLRRSGIKLVVAAPGVPVGDYTRVVLHNLGLDDALQNVVSNESDVREVLAKVALGEADAGFVYTTDARTVKGRVATIGIRWSAQPIVQYAIAVVSASPNKAVARAWVKRLLRKPAQAKLLEAGFLRIK
ncbi:MAG TPA: molybdate ABC transporter substrate-binding protein [Gaiellaceae bacterium]|jgi:molybdate transport system substrate-binding protein|nr:molybdate ABC transporter substrate-binding protein [Gaiellaceae bacterium]